MRIEAAIDRGETCLPPIKKQTKCAKMTDENDATIIKNGINGVVAGSCPTGGGGGGSSSGVAASTGAAINVSRGNAINLSSGGSSSHSGISANSQRIQYGSSGCPSTGNESNGSQQSQDPNGGPHGSSGNNADSVRAPTTGFGGRLQFFKDGKFILELARSREGERTGWVSVPRKTYWPPSASTTPATNSTYPKNESSTSLSFSDDNSSIQSSPWQRDHCWKQATPKKSVSKGMSMFFKRTRKFALSHDGYKTAQMKRRRPHDNSFCKIPFTLVKNGLIKSEPIDLISIKKEPEDTDGGDEKMDKEDKESEGVPQVKVEDCESSKKSHEKEQDGKKQKTRAKLSSILEKLIDRLPTGLYYLSKVNPPPSSGILNHLPASVRISELHNHQQHVSPRKRILRELEKVSLEDNSTKRSRAKVNASNAVVSTASTSANSSNSQHQSIVSASIHRPSMSNNNNAHNNNINQTSNGNTVNTDANSNNSSSRLYSSYSIHSLLGHTNSNKNDTNAKDNLDSTCLQIMLTSPNSSETYYSSRSTYTNSSGKRKSPNYAVPSDAHNHNRRSSRESPNNYGPNYQSESSLSPDPANRYKSSGGTNAGATSFHPYLSSPKYSSNASSPTMLNDGFKQKSGYSSGSPSHSQVTSKISTSTTSRSPIVSTYSQQSPLSNKNTNLNNRFREQSPIESSPSGPSSADRRDGTPRTVPKKTVAFRQQFSSPTSSPSVVQAASEQSNIYKSPSDQKRKNSSVEEQRTLSPESNKLYQASLDQLDQQHRASLLRATPVLPPSSYYYLHPPHGSPGAHASQPSYIPPLSYYPLSSYAAAVAALRNPLWMHYQTAGLLPGPSSRLPFPYNGESGLGPPHPPPAPPGLSAMHLASGPVASWPSSLNLQNSATDDPVSLVNVKDEHNADVPLNLSKH